MKKTLIITGVIALIFLGVISYYRIHTKSFSPETEVNFESGELKIRVTYSRPYKKGRVIFAADGLAPYGKVWRTGANEATTFETNQDLKFSGNVLKKGTYTLFTIPQDSTWKIIFNSEYGQWGIDFNGVANRDAKDDVLTVDVPSRSTNDKIFEQFTIQIEKVDEEMEMILLWDKTLVAVPFSK